MKIVKLISLGALFGFIMLPLVACEAKEDDNSIFFHKLVQHFVDGEKEVYAKDIYSGNWDEVCLIGGDSSGPTPEEMLDDYLTQNSSYSIQGSRARGYIESSVLFVNRKAKQIMLFTQNRSKFIDKAGYEISEDEEYIDCMEYKKAKFVGSQNGFIQLK